MKSKNIQEYFNKIKEDTLLGYDIASRAKKKGFDPDKEVSILLTENMAERVEGLVSVAAPQIKDSGLVEEIANLEKKYGTQDWKVAFKIAEKVAKQELCKFKDQREAMEVALRVGLAYITNGVVSSPLEGFVRLELKKRKDEKEYFCLYFSGPIRSAGTTAVCVFVVLSDYIRKIMNYAEYDPTKEEIKRSSCEVYYFHDRATNLQYLPSEREIEFLTEHMPVQIDGDPSEKIEVPNYKDLSRIGTNKLRNGFSLVMAEGLSQKFPKFWGKFSKWYLDFGMDHWIFIEKYIELQKEVKSKGEIKKGSDAKISPNYTYIKDLVAGRPILSYPLRNGGFRLRYGRSRNSGFSAEAVHPATLFILNKYLAIGTQLRIERPNKSTVISICDSIEGPIVKLKNGEVLFIESVEQAKTVIDEIKEILFLGDILINYGDFLVFNHILVPAGYCEEWWNLELKKVYSGGDDKINKILNQPYNISFDDAYEISKKYKIPFYPKYIFHWNDINYEQFSNLIDWLNHSVIKDEKIILPYDFNEDSNGSKRALEILGLPHKVISKEYVVIEGDWCNALKINLGFYNKKLDSKFILKKVESDKPIIEGINNISDFKIRDKSGTYIGARMGRPEKAKMRKLIGSPHILFPVGDEGGRLRCFQSTLEKGKIKAQFSIFKCDSCNKETIYPLCEKCGSLTKPIWVCKNCGRIDYECEHNPVRYDIQELDIKYYFKSALDVLGLKEYPALIKGVRGTSNKNHYPEHLAKGILRAIHNIYVNKDGTVRYDMTEMPITHFKPKEIRVSIEKLEKLGYTKDIYGKDLINDDQILELKCQDIILPSCPEALEEGADSILFRVANFIDDLLEKLYCMEKYFNFNSKDDLIGHYVVSLSPHTASGVVARIIGFSKTQGFLAHPFLHSIMRRDCDGDEAGVMLLMDALLNFSRNYLPAHRGATQDEPIVLNTNIIASEVDDMVYDMDVCWKYPLELYEAGLEYKRPHDLKLDIVRSRLGTEKQYEGFGFTNNVEDINEGIRCSAYKTIPTMEEKVIGQMDLAERIRAVDRDDVAKLIIDRHFIRDIKGNLRKFSMQQFRCVSCNEKYRRVPLTGICKCGGKLIFTVSEGNVKKYLEPSLSLSKKYELPLYLKQSLELVKQRVESVFGKEKDKQEGLGKWFG